MQTIKQKTFYLFALLLTISTIHVAFSPPATALTEDQIRKCYEDWNNESFIQGDEEYRIYLASGCNVSEACGNTQIDPGRPVTVKCTNPDQTEYIPPGGPDGDAAGDGVDCAVLPGFICNAAQQRDLENSAIWLMLTWIINILTVGVGVLAVGAIVFAGFLYATARDDAGQVKKSIEIIRNTAIGLIAYAFMYAILNFLIPGGIFAASHQSNSLANQHITQENKPYEVA